MLKNYYRIPLTLWRNTLWPPQVCATQSGSDILVGDKYYLHAKGHTSGGIINDRCPVTLKQSTGVRVCAADSMSLLEAGWRSVVVF